MSRGPPFGHSPVRAAGQNIPAAPHPGAALPTSGTVPGRFSKSSSGDIASCQAEARPLSAKAAAGEGLLWGFLTSPSGIPHLPLPCGATTQEQEFLKMWERCKVPVTLPGQHSAQGLFSALGPDFWYQWSLCCLSSLLLRGRFISQSCHRVQ